MKKYIINCSISFLFAIILLGCKRDPSNIVKLQDGSIHNCYVQIGIYNIYTLECEDVIIHSATNFQIMSGIGNIF